MPSRLAGTGAGKHFVPGAETGFFTVHRDRQFPFVADRLRAIRVAARQAAQVLLQRQGFAGSTFLASAQLRRPAAKFGRVVFRSSMGCFFQQHRADEQIHAGVLPGGHSLAEIVLPGPETVGPPFDGVEVPAHFRHTQLGPPAVIANRIHRLFEPGGPTVASIQEATCHQIVTLRVDVRFHNHTIAHNALHRIPAAIDLRSNSLNDDSLSPWYVHQSSPQHAARVAESERFPAYSLPANGGFRKGVAFRCETEPLPSEQKESSRTETEENSRDSPVKTQIGY